MTNIKYIIFFFHYTSYDTSTNKPTTISHKPLLLEDCALSEYPVAKTYFPLKISILLDGGIDTALANLKSFDPSLIVTSNVIEDVVLVLQAFKPIKI